MAENNPDYRKTVPKLLSDLSPEDIPLITQLSPRYRNAVDRVTEFLSPIVTGRPPGNEVFTDHDLQHSYRVLRRIGQILPEGSKLTDAETYILVLSAILHDTGMWIEKNEALSLIEHDDRFLDFSKKHYPKYLRSYNVANKSDDTSWIANAALTIIAAAYARAKHPERLGTKVLDGSSDMGHSLRGLIGNEFVAPIVTVALSHSWKRETVLNDDQLRTQMIGIKDESVELRYLSFLLRIGDLLDFGNVRVSPLLWQYLEPLGHVSESHWIKESLLNLEMCTSDEITISGFFDIDEGGMKSAEAYRLANEWIDYIKQEIKEVGYHLIPFLPDRLSLGKLFVDDSRVRATGLAIEGKVEFSLSRQDIVRLLGKELYSGDFIFIRELIQNSVDATRLRLLGKNIVPEKISEEHTSAIEISIQKAAPEQQLSRFKIRDYGIGMNLNTLRMYFLQVGRSFYSTEDFSDTPEFSPISRFGIGFLSCLLAAERIEITTKAEGETKALRLSMQMPSECFLVENVLDSVAEDFPVGTEVDLLLDQNKLHLEEGDHLPIKDPELCDIFDTAGDNGNIFCATKQYCKFLDVPVKLNGEELEKFDLKSTKVIKQEVTSSPTEFCPIALQSPNGNHLASGGFTYLTLRQSGLPQITGKIRRHGTGSSVLISSRGMYAHSNVNFNEPCIAINLEKGPANLLTAGREVRRDALHLPELKREVFKSFLVSWFEEIRNQLGMNSASYWRLSIRGGELATGLPVYLPSLSTDGQKWTTFEDMKRDHKMFLLVPFALPLTRKSWSRRIPCLGIPGRLVREELEIAIDSNDCKLVPVDTATSLLWPPHSDFDFADEVLGLKFLKKPASKFESGIAFWGFENSEDARYRTLGSGKAVDEDFLNPEDLPKYDHEENPWIQMGLNRVPLSTSSLTSGDQHNLIGDRLRTQEIRLPKLPVNIELAFGDDWI